VLPLPQSLALAVGPNAGLFVVSFESSTSHFGYFVTVLKTDSQLMMVAAAALDHTHSVTGARPKSDLEPLGRRLSKTYRGIKNHTKHQLK
jgi:hypothetical protein